MDKLLRKILVLMFVLFLSGCGNSGSTGNGNTVFITSSLKQGTTGAVFANFSGAIFANLSGTRFNPVQSANLMNFTLKSTPYSASGTFKNSDVIVSNIACTFTPVSPAPSFVATAPNTAYSGLLTPGGTLDIDNVPILYDEDIKNILILLGPNRGLFEYNVSVTFTGVEANTGMKLYTTSRFSAFIQKK